jgi:hypothetical protein
LGGQQIGNLTVNLHLGFESYKTEDTAILQLKQDLNTLVHMWSTPNNTKFLRRMEVQSVDHTNVQEFIISYGVSGFDYSAMNGPTTEALIDTLITNNSPQIDNSVIRSGAIPDSVILSSELGYELLSESGYKLVIQQ